MSGWGGKGPPPPYSGPNRRRSSFRGVSEGVIWFLDSLVHHPRRRGFAMVRSCLPLPLILIMILQMGWILFDRYVTSQTYHPPPRPFIRPTESSPLSPFYGPDYDTLFQGPIIIKVFPSKPFPCSQLISERRLDNPGPSSWKNGFLFVMPSHAGGTTLAGMTTRIARNVAARTMPHPTTPNTTESGGNTADPINTTTTTKNHSKNATTTTLITRTGTGAAVCATWNSRTRGRRLQNRNKETSVLWSMVREPVDRMVSRFFHEVVSFEGPQQDRSRRLEETFQHFVENSASLEYGTALRTLTMRTLRRHVSPYGSMELMQQYVREVLDSYDFLGILERLPESLATLQLLLGLETQDMLYLTTRSGDAWGGASYTTWTNPKSGERKCVKLQPNKVTLPLKEFLHQPFLFEEVFELDIYLYKAINQSLDATMESLGRDKVDRAVKRLVWGQKQVEEKCSKTVTFPCSEEGTAPIRSPDCIVDDVACGYQCLDAIGKTMANDPDFLKI